MTYVDRALQKLREDNRFHTVKASTLEREQNGRTTHALEVEIECENEETLKQLSMWMEEAVSILTDGTGIVTCNYLKRP